MDHLVEMNLHSRTTESKWYLGHKTAFQSLKSGNEASYRSELCRYWIRYWKSIKTSININIKCQSLWDPGTSNIIKRSFRYWFIDKNEI